MTRTERIAAWCLLPLFVAAGVFGWSLQLRAPLAVEASALGDLPMQIASWQGRDLGMDGGVEEMLDADFHVNRAYVHRVGDLVWLYVGYYGTERGGRPEHTPWACYPSNGWTIVSSDVVDVVPGVRANELVVEKDGGRRLVHFWYQSNRKSGMLGGFDQALDRFVGRLQAGRADGSLVRLSTPVEGDDEWSARGRLGAFAREILPQLGTHWPHEVRRADRDAASRASDDGVGALVDR